MMGLVRRLFSSPEAINETIKSARRGIDDLVYTDQERAEFTQHGQELYSKLFLASVPSALSRRIIAIFVVFTFCFLCVLGVVFYAIGAAFLPDVVPVDMKPGGMILAAEFTFRVVDSVLLGLVTVIVGFYFLKQVVTDYQHSKK